MNKADFRLRATVEEMTRARTNTDNELVNLRINLEEAKNENVTILQVRVDDTKES